ncbi:MAG TPA: hypothetical protein VK909_21050 [Anaerolineales bacterium]|nr:hypothetical protein [Anaerolineales bacterium]
MDHQPYIPGMSPAEPGPLARFTPPLEEGVISRWLPLHAPLGSWLLDPFGFSPRLVLEAARMGYRVLVAVNNPITRFLLETSAKPPSESDFKAAMADLAVAKKGDERLAAHLQSLYLTTCEKCGQQIQAESFLWRKGEIAPYARIYTCPHCADSGERPVQHDDIERAKQISSTDSLHRSRAFERVAALDDEDRVYVEEAIQFYLPRPLYFLTTVVSRMDSLYLTPERKRALHALILTACDAGNTLWGYPSERPRPKQLIIPNQFREFNLWTQLERGLARWTQTASPVACEAWPQRIPESGGICIYEGRLKDLAHEVKKEIPITAVIASLPRPNQAFWTLSALWAGWLWGGDAVEPFKIALRRRRYDWAWNATALNAAFAHLFDLLPLGTPFFGFLPEAEPSFLTAALTAASAAGFDLQSLAMRTEHDPIQLVWQRGEHLKRESNAANVNDVRAAIGAHLMDRQEPASYLHVHAAGLLPLVESHSLKQKEQEFDEVLRSTQSLIQTALAEDSHFVHYSSGESVDTGFWGLLSNDILTQTQSDRNNSLSDQVEIAIVTFLQKNPHSIFLEVEDDIYPRFPGLLTPSKGLIYSVLSSYAERTAGAWELRPEDVSSARRNELKTIAATIESMGTHLEYSTHRQDKNVFWLENGRTRYAFHLLASGLIGRALTEVPYSAEQTIFVIPGGRAGLITYKTQRDPALAARLKDYRLVKYRHLRTLAERPTLTREAFEQQLASDPLEKSKGQIVMF